MNAKIRISLFASIAALASLAGAAPAEAQEVTRLPETAQQSLGLDTGLEDGVIVRATYQHKVDIGALRDVRLYARGTLPFVTPDLGDWALDGGMRATVASWHDLRLAFLYGPVVKSTANRLFSAVGLGLGATMLAGYEGPRWGLSLEVGYEHFITTHMHHTDTYRDVVFADAKDGWYAFSGGTSRLGLRGGGRIGPVEIFARGGVDATAQLSAHTPPYYAALGSSYAF